MARKKTKQASILASLPQELRQSFISKRSAGEGEVKESNEAGGDHLQGQEISETTESVRPAKKRRIDCLLPENLRNHDATGLVPFYNKAEDVPQHLKKCKHLMLLKIIIETK